MRSASSCASRNSAPRSQSGRRPRRPSRPGSKPRARRQQRALRGVCRPGRQSDLGPPRTKASVRTVPLPRVVVDALAAYPVGPDGLVFTIGGEPITRGMLGHIWRGPARSVGIPTGQGLHALRHYYASLLIRHGESVKVVQARLGHASAAETLDTHSHPWPDSDDRTREAVDAVLGGRLADSVRTGNAS
jgi:integrase